MRVLAIGMGGAGCRIAEALYANDRKSSKVTCVQALAVDIDSDALAQLRVLPERAKIDFTEFEPDISRQGSGSSRPVTIDTAGIMSRIQNMERCETDAILLCLGMGGRMTDAVPQLIYALKASTTEPIFGLVTLPALSEGERRSAKAADDVDNITPLLDGTILFDNETWLKKIAARRDQLLEDLSKGPGLFGLGRNKPKPSAQEITYKLLNQSIIRRISLILRAGEFRADGGIDLAEVVMDSSEVLNTINGMGFISIGYAVEHLSQSPLAFLSRLHTPDTSAEQRKSAERIIDLAKKAIYQEVSIPCDMTSAAKALILVAGPSHEISMKGFMTVRKWIDRSIAGMEMRSGDYPVTNSENVAIIVVLSGLENIPRITEIREIRDQSRGGVPRESLSSLNLQPEGQIRNSGEPENKAAPSGTKLRDVMINIPEKNPKKRSSLHSSDYEADQYPDILPASIRATHSMEPDDSRKDVVRPRILEETRSSATKIHSRPEEHKFLGRQVISQREPLIASPEKREEDVYPRQTKEQSIVPSGQEIRRPARRSLESGYEGNLPLKHVYVKERNPDHLAIERDLQERKEIIKSAISYDRNTQAFPVQSRIAKQPETKTIIARVTSRTPVQRPTSPSEPAPAKTEKTIIRQRKKETGTGREFVYQESATPKGPSRQEELEPAIELKRSSITPSQEEVKLGIRNRLQPARDDIFLGKSVSLKEPLRVKDGALLHTEIRTKKAKTDSEEEDASEEQRNVSPLSKKRSGKMSIQDDE